MDSPFSQVIAERFGKKEKTAIDRDSEQTWLNTATKRVWLEADVCKALKSLVRCAQDLGALWVLTLSWVLSAMNVTVLVANQAELFMG